MSQLNYLNLGCGNTFHPDWINIDLKSNSPHVREYNLLKGIPYPDNSLDVVYHSHVLEHFTREDGQKLLEECLRVIKPGGIIRIVVPDLENIVREYLRHLETNLTNPTAESRANYDWVMIELLDQSIRNASGGEMSRYLSRPTIPNEDYVMSRIGFMGKWLRKQYLRSAGAGGGKRSPIRRLISAVAAYIRNLKFMRARAIGNYRMSGEVHMWMYDRYSLGALLSSAGYEDIEVKDAFESNIPDWLRFGLDVRDGEPYIPTSLYMEARKPR